MATLRFWSSEVKGSLVPLFLIVVGMLGLIGGAFLIGQWAIGCAVIVDSALMITAGVYWRDDVDDMPTTPVDRWRAEP